ncbi:hypothetical protein BEN47_10690 [Hymenobacter lapidarius]|uniref:Uncharacterized protein n=1 Tax=Hymenobacter lapidarius TaxID=1908237 RepID=A0A1G1T956_9BACT|nr:hypothetical protein BEN47_10690 [Hymenobacter lapidarius]
MPITCATTTPGKACTGQHLPPAHHRANVHRHAAHEGRHLGAQLHPLVGQQLAGQRGFLGQLLGP